MKRIGFGSRGMVAVYVSKENYAETGELHLGPADNTEFIKRAHDPFNLSGRFASSTYNDTSL